MQTRHHIRCKNKENHTPERPETTEPPKMTRRSHFPLLHAQGLGFPPHVGKGALHFCNPATQSGRYLLHFSDPATQSRRYLLHFCAPRKLGMNLPSKIVTEFGRHEALMNFITTF